MKIRYTLRENPLSNTCKSVIQSPLPDAAVEVAVPSPLAQAPAEVTVPSPLAQAPTEVAVPGPLAQAPTEMAVPSPFLGGCQTVLNVTITTCSV